MGKSKAKQLKVRALIQELHQKGCTDCQKYLPGQMSFDHLPEFHKLFNISQAYYFSWAAIQEELLKCQVVCKQCHKKREVQRRPKSLSRQTLGVSKKALGKLVQVFNVQKSLLHPEAPEEVNAIAKVFNILVRLTRKKSKSGRRQQAIRWYKQRLAQLQTSKESCHELEMSATGP